MAGVSIFPAEQGWAAVNINYRLLTNHPFPAPLGDVLTAYRWHQDTDQEDLCRRGRVRVALLGASAGGFLAMAAGSLGARQPGGGEQYPSDQSRADGRAALLVCAVGR